MKADTQKEKVIFSFLSVKFGRLVDFRLYSEKKCKILDFRQNVWCILFLIKNNPYSRNLSRLHFVWAELLAKTVFYAESNKDKNFVNFQSYKILFP